MGNYIGISNGKIGWQSAPSLLERGKVRTREHACTSDVVSEGILDGRVTSELSARNVAH